jgi:4a-hydroxytetrahydrobiopterin dehydratase
MTTELSERHCEPCHGGVPPLEEDERRALLERLEPGWEVVDGHHLSRTFEFDDFVSALEFTNRVGELAEEEGHHPLIHLTWGEATVDIWTHAIDDLTDNDFILAAKIDEL